MKLYRQRFDPVLQLLKFFSLRIADIVADEHRKFYLLFSKEELQALLSQLADSARALLVEDPHDPLGYSFV